MKFYARETTKCKGLGNEETVNNESLSSVAPPVTKAIKSLVTLTFF